MIERRKSRLWAVESLFDELNDGVCIADESGALLYVNPAAKKLLELPDRPASLESLCSLLCERLQGPGLPGAAKECPLRAPDLLEERSISFLGRHGPRSGFKWSGDVVARAERFRDLRVRCLRAKLPIAGTEEKLHLVLIEDASAEMELQRHKEDWRAMIAHDLRAPLTSVYAGLRLLEEAHPPNGKTDPDADVVQMGLRSCRRMMELLDLYLDVAKFDAGAAKTRIEPVSVFDAVDAAVAEQAALASAQGSVIEVDVRPGLKALADAELLSRVIENLLNNAVKYGERGGRILVKAVEKDGKVCVGVKDEGPGIEERLLPFLFDRFYQADARRAGKLKGNGLGLTFCREAALLMGAELTVQSAPGLGSEFTLILPGAP